MKVSRKVLIGVAVIGSVVGGLAWATPIFNLTSPFLATGNHAADIESRSEYEPSEFKAFVKTEGPSTFIIQDAAYLPGGHNGWHSHPGLIAVTVLAGSIEWFDADCKMTPYKAGDSWVEGSQVHYFRVTSATNLHLMASYIIAKGAPPRIDQPAPACAASLGLN